MMHLSNLIIATTAAMSSLILTSLPIATSSFVIKSQFASIDCSHNNFPLHHSSKERRNHIVRYHVDSHFNTNYRLSSSGDVRLQMSFTSNSNNDNLSPKWTDTFGSSALKQVQNLASVVSAANEDGASLTPATTMGSNDPSTPISQEEGNAATMKKNNMSGDTDALFSNLTEQRGIKGQNRKVVLSALESLERDSKFILFDHVLYYIFNIQIKMKIFTDTMMLRTDLLDHPSY